MTGPAWPPRPLVRLNPVWAEHPLPVDALCGACGWHTVAASLSEGCDRARAHLADHASWTGRAA